MRHFKLFVAAAACMLFMAGASFAQVAFTTTSTTDLIAPNAETGSVGNILLTALGPGNIGGPVLGTDTLILGYSEAQISVLGGVAVTIDVDGAPGGELLFGAGSAAGPFTEYGTGGSQTLGTVTVTVNTTDITVSFSDAAPVSFLAQGYIRVVGVRLNVSDIASVDSNITATMFSIGGQVTVTNPIVPVALVRDPINYYPEDDARIPAKMSTAGVGIDYAPTSSTRASMYVRFRETSDFTDAFETQGVNAATQLIFTISDIPDGIVVDTGSGHAPTVYDKSGTVSAAVSSTSQKGSTATIKVDVTAQDALTREWIGLKVEFKSTVSTIAAGTATLNVTLGPAATSSQLEDEIDDGAGGLLVDASNPLKYAELPEPDLNALVVAPVKTYLMSTWNVYVPPLAAGGSGFSTGYAVSNTSGILEVGKQTDVIKVTFYPYDGSAAKSFTTGPDHKPGIGLDADGNLPPGATWAVLISDLLPEAGITGGFQGMVIFECNFTNAHGVNFIADGLFESNSQGYQMLLLPSSRNKTSEQLTH